MMRAALPIIAALIISALTLIGVGAVSPGVAKADHPDPNMSCKEWSASHDLILSDANYNKVCGMTADMQKEFDRILYSTNCGRPITPGGEPLQCGFVAPVSAATVKRIVAETPKLRTSFETAGAGAPTAVSNLFFRMLAPDGSVSGLRVPDVKGELAPGAAGMSSQSIASRNGTIVADGMTQYIGVVNEGDSNYVTARVVGRSTGAEPDFSTPLAGNFGIKCSDGYVKYDGITADVGTTSKKFQVPRPLSPGCQFFVQDLNYQGSDGPIRTFGPTLDTSVSTTGQSVSNPGYNVTGFGEPTRETHTAPTGDAVLAPHETRIIYDNIVADPEYKPLTNPETDPDADPDHDGDPNVTDPDDDNDGVPDSDDPAPNDPTQPVSAPNNDPDRDGEPNRTDTDDDNDGLPDDQDPAPNNPAQPVSAPNNDPDGDGEPNKTDTDDDGDGVPDQDDSSPYDPNQGTNETAPPPSGEPAPGGSTPPPPSPDDSGTEPPPPTEETACEGIKPFVFKLPKLELFNVFPFSLVLKAWMLMQSFVATPERPTFDLPMFGTVTVPDAMDSGIEMFRGAIAVVSLIGMCWMFYRTISGAGGGGAG